MSNNLVACNNLAISNNLAVNGSIVSSGDIQTTRDLTCNDVTAVGTMYTNNLTLTGTINNTVTMTNLLSLDTTSSIQTQLNSKVSKTGDETIAGQKTFSTGITLNGSDLNTRISSSETTLSTIASRLNVDTSGNVVLKTIAPNTTLNVGVNNTSKINLASNGRTTIQNNTGANDVVLNVSDTVSNKKINFVPNAGTGAYNFITKAGSAIYSDSTTPLTLTQSGSTCTGVVIDSNNLLIGSGNNTSSANPQNYLYFNNGGIGVNKTNPAYPLDVNGIVKFNDIFLTAPNSDGLTSATVSQRINSVSTYATTIDNNLQSVQTQIATINSTLTLLRRNCVKAFGYYNGTTWVRGSNYILRSEMATAAGLYGLQIWFQNIDFQSELQGIIQATPDNLNGGYTIVGKYLGVTGTPNNGPAAISAVFSVYWGGSNPGVLSPSAFHFTLI
jgi:hypothetical protein